MISNHKQTQCTSTGDNFQCKAGDAAHHAGNHPCPFHPVPQLVSLRKELAEAESALKRVEKLLRLADPNGWLQPKGAGAAAAAAAEARVKELERAAALAAREQEKAAAAAAALRKQRVCCSSSVRTLSY